MLVKRLLRVGIIDGISMLLLLVTITFWIKLGPRFASRTECHTCGGMKNGLPIHRFIGLALIMVHVDHGAGRNYGCRSPSARNK